MASCKIFLYDAILLSLFLGPYLASAAGDIQTSTLLVDGSSKSTKRISDHFFGVFLEEINHACTGGLWAELISNRGFEAGGTNVPSNIEPWNIIGNEKSVVLSTELSSPFKRNKVALRMDVLCNKNGHNPCPAGGVGVSNPGYWGMNIEQGKKYRLVFFVRSTISLDLMVSLVGSKGQKLASTTKTALDVSSWTKMETELESKATDRTASLHFTTTENGTVWLDQVSLMPMDTYKGHGFRHDLFQMVANLKPKFLRFPGGTFVEGDFLRNAFRWKDTVGPWEGRPGHLNDIWGYWTDDAMGFYEYLQLSEDLGALPIWVFNNGISRHDEVDPSLILPFVQEALDGIEFANGPATSKWGSARARMGHSEPFNLKHVAIGNEDCERPKYYGNYLIFYSAIKKAYPYMQIISNCDASQKPLNHSADIYDYHLYKGAKDMFNHHTWFDKAPRAGAKAFVSEYAVWKKKDARNGSLLAAVAEAGFLLGLEKNSDLVEMVSYAPLFVNTNDRRWTPDAIVFSTHQSYGTPSYWLQKMFIESNGAIILDSTLKTSSTSFLATAITWHNSADNKNYIRIKVVNFSAKSENLKISIRGLASKIQPFGSTKTVLTSDKKMDENSFSNPNKVVPKQSPLDNAGKEMNVALPPYSVSAFDLLI